jgi:tRNA (guanine26-N2/guanine27-N2)-dimethyltransferase
MNLTGVFIRQVKFHNRLMSGEVRKIICEGSARIALPEGQVFYNPVQVFNRDLSVLAINQFCNMNSSRKEFNVLEALSATGLRAVRYAHECPKLTNIVANDIDPEASKLIDINVDENRCRDKVKSSCGDANLVMLQASSAKKPFDIIDLDPYGSAVPFLDSVMQAIADGGLLCITCTDMAALCASYNDACLAKYGSIPVKGDICHEFAVRIILNSVERAASRFKCSIEPLMSCAIDFYSRVFVRVHRGKGDYLRAAPFNSGYLLKCPDCRNFEIQPICRSLAKNERSFKIGPSPLMASGPCSFCHGNVQLAGPFWTGPLHCKEFVNGLFNSSIPETITTSDRIKGMVSVCEEECQLPPLYISIGELAHTLKAPTPPMDHVLYALKNAGYNISIPHCSPNSVKSNAPFRFFLSIFHFVLKDTTYKFDDGTDSVRSRIWRSFFSTNGDLPIVNLEKNETAIPSSKRSNAVRFPPNPEKNWGPKPKAKPLAKVPKLCDDQK